MFGWKACSIRRECRREKAQSCVESWCMRPLTTLSPCICFGCCWGESSVLDSSFIDFFLLLSLSHSVTCCSPTHTNTLLETLKVSAHLPMCSYIVFDKFRITWALQLLFISAYKNNMTKVTQFEFEVFNNPQLIYFPGQPVSGVLVVTTDGACKTEGELSPKLLQILY